MWIVSPYSFPNGNCAEVELDGPFILARDTKNRGGAMLRYTSDAWRRFIRQTKE
jgi:Domain of unknown function (DUF397)